MEGVERVEQMDDHPPSLGRQRRRQAQGVGRRDHRAAARPQGRLACDERRRERRRGDLRVARFEPDPGQGQDGRRSRGHRREHRPGVGVPQRQVKDDLERFKKFIESRGSETGAWRGEVDGGDVKGATSADLGSPSLQALGPPSALARRAHACERWAAQRTHYRPTHESGLSPHRSTALIAPVHGSPRRERCLACPRRSRRAPPPRRRRP